jgi:hypothetical protein
MIFIVYFAPMLQFLYLLYDFYGLFFAIIWTWYLIYIFLAFYFTPLLFHNKCYFMAYFCIIVLDLMVNKQFVLWAI